MSRVSSPGVHELVRRGRFRAAQEREEQTAEAERKGIVIDKENLFDSNCITPGTEFMVMVRGLASSSWSWCVGWHNVVSSITPLFAGSAFYASFSGPRVKEPTPPCPITSLLIRLWVDGRTET
jgi:hypothetical protein